MYEPSSMGVYTVAGKQIASYEFHTPFSIGEMETGTHSPEANSFILFMDTDCRFNSWKKELYELTYKYLCRPNNVFERYKKDPMTTDYVFSFDRGIWALNDISQALNNRFYLILKTAVAQYNKLDEVEQIDLKDRVIGADVRNWIMRDFQDWCNENKRIAA